MTRTPTVAEVQAVLDATYDPRRAEEWDAVGLVAGDRNAAVHKILRAVDPADAVIDEAVLYRPVGSGEGFAGQLEHLLQAARWPCITIRIRPLAAGAPVSPAGFTILRFARNELPDAVYSEQLTSASYVDRPAEVARYAAAMELLESGSRPAAETASVIVAALARLG